MSLADLPKTPGHEDHCWSYSLCWTCYCQGKIVDRPVSILEPMSPDDLTLAKLRQAYPGWRIWHVPGNGRGTWCAQPLPLINVGSPDELARAIEAAQPDSKGFDPEGDTPVRAEGSQGS